ncbi:MAG TPA: DUF4342 domain-containing protein [Desulfosporosinus sp.]|nr:DUF4342 domain-containing protein [Desulfosporosinus sp.]
MSDGIWTELEKLDVLRKRMGLSYEEARTALNLAQGDVLKALDELEEAGEEVGPNFGFLHQQQGLWENAKSTITAFGHSTISLKRYESTIASLSAPLGLALAYTIWRKPGLRLLGLVGAVGAAMNDFELEVANKEDKSYDDHVYNFVTDKKY